MVGELGEAVREDRLDETTTDEVRLASYWASLISYAQWQYQQAQLGLLPTFNEAGTAAALRLFFTTSRGFAGFWETMKPTLSPEFVEWVEEQRSKAA